MSDPFDIAAARALCEPTGLPMAECSIVLMGTRTTLLAALGEIERLRADVVRLTVTYDNTCSCALADATQPALAHAKDCPIRVNKIRRLDPGVALERLAAALHSGDENDELRAEIERLTESLRIAVAVRDDARAASQRRLDEKREAEAEWLQMATMARDDQAKVATERDAYRAMICDLLASAHPHPTEHPTMTRQWARARELLKNGKLNEPTAEQRRQEAGIYLEEGLAEVAKVQAERDAARALALEACDLASPWAVMPPNSTKELVPRLTNVGGIDVAERIKAIRKACTP